MKSITSISIKFKLIFMVFTSVAITMLLSFVVLTGLSNMNDNINQLVDIDSTKMDLSNKMIANLIEMHRAEKNMIIALTEKEMNLYRQSYTEAQQKLDSRTILLRELMDDTNKLDHFQENLKKYKTVFKKIAEYTFDNSNQKAKALLRSDARDKILLVHQLSSELHKIVEREFDAEIINQKKSNEIVIKIANTNSIMNKFTIALLSADKIPTSNLVKSDMGIVKQSNSVVQLAINLANKLKRSTDKKKHKNIDKMIKSLQDVSKIQLQIMAVLSNEINEINEINENISKTASKVSKKQCTLHHSFYSTFSGNS